MFVYVIDKNNTPVEPITSAEARIKIDNNKAKIYSKAPFIIQLDYVSLKSKFNVDLHINIVNNNIEIVAVSKNGNLYYVDVFSEPNLIDKVSGAFLFLLKYVPFDSIYYLINNDALFIFNKSLIELKNDSFSINDKINTIKCKICEKNKPSKIFKVYDDYSFYGNSFYVCSSCFKKFKNNELTAVVNPVKESMRVLKETIDLFNTILKENKNA